MATTTTVPNPTTHLVTSTIKASEVPPLTQLTTSVVTASPTGASVAPITVVVTSVYAPPSATNSQGFSSTGGSKPAASTSVRTSTLSVLPLTTIFTPPASCSTRPFTLSTSNGSVFGFWGYPSASADPCYPTDWATAKTNYYTPGACPQGHTYAGIFVGQSLSVPYTSVNCCPRYVGYRLVYGA